MVNYADYSIVLCFYVPLIFYGDSFSEELKYYVIGFPIIFFILLSCAFYSTIAIYQGFKSTRYFLLNIELPKDMINAESEEVENLAKEEGEEEEE